MPTAPGGSNKSTVNYRHFESCKTCMYFNGRVNCDQVEGRVSPEMVCDLWAKEKLTKGMTGKEFMKREFEKSVKKELLRR